MRRQCLTQRQQAVQRETPFYVNGGFVGLSRVHRGFLYAWRRAMTLFGEEIGGLERSMFSFGAANRAGIHLPSYPFNKTDQDALNIAVMTALEPVSIMGSEAWISGRAAGRCRARSAWKNRGEKRFIRAAFGGWPPSFADVFAARGHFVLLRPRHYS